MFTDMVGYTALGQRNESLSLALVEEQRKLIRPILSRHNGREVKTIGDAFLVDFPNALDAVRCAYDIQRATREFNISLPAERRIHLRVGLHLGDVVESQGDISGDAVNVASRIEPLAEDGGVCITRQVYDHVLNKFELPLMSLGPKALKNVSALVEVYKMMMPWEEERAPLRSILDKRRIAVLPFTNISPDPNDAYFADGLTEELIAKLSTISGLKVIARTSIMRYRGTSKSVREIGKELESGSVLEGSVRKAADRLRVTAQLIDATTQEHLWVQNYDRQLEDVFAIQTEVAQNVADALKMQLLDVERQQIEKKPTGDISAYAFYLKGRYYWNERSRESLGKSIEYFEEALKRDSEFALAYSGIADSYIVLVDHGYLARSEGYAKAGDAATKALKLDDTLAEAHTSLANILSREWDWRGAGEEFDKALRANPNYATAHHWYSIHLLETGRLDEAIKEWKIAEELDPLSPMIHAYGALVYVHARQYDIALAESDKALELDPNFVSAHFNRIWVYLSKSMFDEAMADQERVLPALQPLSYDNRALVGAAYAIAGRTEEAKRILREWEEASAHERAEDVNHWALALIHLKLGNKDRAFESLEKAIKAHTITPFQVKLFWFFDEMTSDARFDELMKKTVGSLTPTQG
jgi:TolB-like protein/Tfp pilus assembly protein PilF